MPTIDLSYTAEIKSGDDFLGTITDETTYTSPTRAGGAFYISGSKLNADGTVSEALSFSSYDNEVATEYTFTIPQDGWHQFYGVFLPDYDNGATYNQYEAVYQDSNNIAYKSIYPSSFSAVAPPNATYWESVSDPTTLVENDGTSTESPNLSFQIYERIIYPNAKTFAGTAAADAAGDCGCERSEDVLTYEQANLNVDALNNYDFRGQYAQGETLARASDELIAQNA